MHFPAYNILVYWCTGTHPIYYVHSSVPANGLVSVIIKFVHSTEAMGAQVILKPDVLNETT